MRVPQDVSMGNMHAISDLSVYRWILFSGVVSTLLGLVVSVFAMREIDVDNNNAVSAFQPHRGSPFSIIREILMTTRFWRFLLFIGLLTGVRLVFRHLDATLPKYLTRTLGCGAPYGTVYSINPAMIIILVSPLANPKGFPFVQNLHPPPPSSASEIGKGTGGRQPALPSAPNLWWINQVQNVRKGQRPTPPQQHMPPYPLHPQ